ncbi:hypothetical protein H7J51_25980 [Mycobacterium crocinum]|uniref:Uncharacterized protein n=1 Tax=Mycolicibacterium crocinum TaxID=388459 RepID=A0ABY3TUV7_9MYCO|nr:hypothetical protein [Mycolicibacterium crocinum]MCV7218710.1 hypothetical protein [Mycolicibacterium crocinum]ULN43883.1 hypothetical protein MI149_12905 [Mycolicibacterium crocinum]
MAGVRRTVRRLRRASLAEVVVAIAAVVVTAIAIAVVLFYEPVPPPEFPGIAPAPNAPTEH